MQLETEERTLAAFPRFPVHLIVMSDNTCAQAKNQHAFTFLALLVARRMFSTVSFNFLMVGHTHEDIDFLFSLFVSLVLARYRFQCSGFGV